MPCTIDSMGNLDSKIREISGVLWHWRCRFGSITKYASKMALCDKMVVLVQKMVVLVCQFGTWNVAILTKLAVVLKESGMHGRVLSSV